MGFVQNSKNQPVRILERGLEVQKDDSGKGMKLGFKRMKVCNFQFKRLNDSQLIAPMGAP